ncbi:MAG: hypothetical protein IJ279_00435 [Clostridia bacterium]|nr:hypothetical protein [Clostridia bacterium]
MKKFLSLFICFLLVFSLTACGDKTDTEVNDDSVQSDLQEKENQEIFDEQETTENTSFTPNTVMDLFDGERRIWYYIDSEAAEDGLAYDNRIQSIFVTENNTVVEFYYSLGNYLVGGNGFAVVPADCPCFSEYFILSDFEGKSNDEIIDMVSSRYANASQTYEFVVNSDYDFLEVKGSPFIANELPYEIKYKGELDASGNDLESECIKFMDKQYILHIIDSKTHHGTNNIEDHTDFKAIIKPTIIKDKEYVGFKGTKDCMMITENTYASFDKIVYDSPDGASEW